MDFIATRPFIGSMRGLVAMGFITKQLYTILCLRQVGTYLENGTFIVEFLVRGFGLRRGSRINSSAGVQTSRSREADMIICGL